MTVEKHGSIKLISHTISFPHFIAPDEEQKRYCVKWNILCPRLLNDNASIGKKCRSSIIPLPKNKSSVFHETECVILNP